MKKLYYKYREIFIFTFCLVVLLVFGILFAEIFIQNYPYLSLTVCSLLFFAGYKLNKK